MKGKTNIIIEDLQDEIVCGDDLLKLIRNSVEFSLKYDKFYTPSEISIVLVDNAKIQEMNNEFRSIDRPTDVLSFPMIDMYEGTINIETGDTDIDEGLLILGDIVVSLEKAQEQSIEYGHSFQREVAFLVTHGVFHLLGYDHDTAERESRMFAKQEQTLILMGLSR